MASSSIEIMILGALIERPMSAYEMDRVLVDEQTGRALIDELIETHLSTADRVDAMIPSYERLEASSTMELCAATYRLVAEHLKHFKEELYPAS